MVHRHEVEPSALDGPTHVGLIPDGLRRWAVANDATLAQSYLLGAHKVTDILESLRGHGVQTVTVYNLSRANLGRHDDELAAVYAASVHFLSTLLPARFHSDACRVRVHGDRSVLPKAYVTAIDTVESLLDGEGFTINVLCAYDARDELRAAHARAQRDSSDIDVAFEIGDVDLVIRTTPEPLLSGFLPLQSQYAQLIFLATPLNDLRDSDIDDLVADYRLSPQRRGR